MILHVIVGTMHPLFDLVTNVDVADCFRSQHLMPPEVKDADEYQARCNIFTSPDFFTNTSCCVVLIQGSGPVRPGLWARSLCINASFTEGSMFPLVDSCVNELKYSVMIPNPNLNDVEVGGDVFDVVGSESPMAHITTVWDSYMSKCPAKKIVILAHSFGGIVVMHLLQKRWKELSGKVQKLLLTDSVHHWPSPMDKEAVAFVRDHCIHYVAASAPLNQSVKRKNEICRVVSAGNASHEWSTHAATPEILKELRHLN